MNGIFEKKDYFQLQCLSFTGFRGFPPMFHPHGELVYVVEGSVSITVDGATHTLVAGEVALVFPYLTHSYEDAPDSKVIVALFDPAVTVFDNTLLTRYPTCFFAPGSQFQPLLERMVAMWRSGRSKTAMSYLNAVIGELLEVLPLAARRSAHESITAQVLTWCAEHFTEDITVKSVADALYISESYVSKLFSQKLRYSFREYINMLRIHKAQMLLADTDQKILQIMTRCGFRNQSSFNRVFRELSGVSPKAYRAKTRSK